jgi:HPt (histidine-containing phosphotransfer) domain-containing protein
VNELQRKLDALNRKFRAPLPAQFDEIETLLDACAAAQDPAAVRAGLQALYRGLHSLAGAAGTFACAELGQEAYDHEQLVQAALAAGDDGVPSALTQLRPRLLAWLAQARARDLAVPPV